MRNVPFSRPIAGLLLITTLSMTISPLFSKKAEALDSSLGASALPSTSVALLQCANQKGQISDALGKVFSGVTNIISGIGSGSSATEAIVAPTDKPGTAFNNIPAGSEDGAPYASTFFSDNQEGSLATDISNAVGSTVDSVTNNVTGAATGSIPVTVSNVDKLTEAQREANDQQARTECLKTIGYAAAKDLLNATTQSIVNWINTGFDGNPLFIQDTRAFFKSIADQEVYSFVAELNNPAKYPFGPEIGQSLATLYSCDQNSYSGSDTNCFKNTAVFTLADDIGSNWQDFYSDFNVGGWGGWLSATQNPANNPIDFQFIASQELQNRIDAHQADLKDELTQGDGFLSLKKCVQYGNAGSNYTYNVGGNAVITNTVTDNGTGGIINTIGGYNNNNYEYSYFGINQVSNCTKYEVTTPGSVIADELNIHLGASAQALAFTDQVNDSLSSIFNALINQLIDKGLSSLGDGASSTSQTGGYGYNISSNSIGASWYVDPYAPTDLHALLRCTSEEDGTAIPGCKTVIQTTEEYLASLYAARDYLNTQVIPALVLLDMRMPEPDLGWQNRMYGVLQTKIAEVNSMTSYEDIDTKIVGPALGIVAVAVNAIPAIGQIASAAILVGAAIAALVSHLIAKNDEEKLAEAKRQGVGTLQTLYETELKRIQWDIDNNNLSSAFDARIQRDKLPGYRQTALAYVNAIKTQEQALSIMKSIETKLGSTAAETPNITAYRTNYAAIAGSVATENDIAALADNMSLFNSDLEQINDISAQILSESQVTPFAGRDNFMPGNLTTYYLNASMVADIAHAIGNCGLSHDDQDPICPVDDNGSPTFYTDANGHTTVYQYSGGHLQNYNPQSDNYHLVDVEANAFQGAAGVAEEATMETVHITADILRLYPFGFTRTNGYQNPYSIFYPFPNPPLAKSPWYYRQLIVHDPGDQPCLDSVCDTDDGWQLGVQHDDPTNVYTHLNVTAFNSFDHADSGDKDIWKRLYLNYFQDAYKDPTYPYGK